MKGILLVKACVFSVILCFSQFSIGQILVGQSLNEDPVLAYELEQVNVNQADAGTIALVLTGIGASRAEAIVAYREEYGLYESIQDLMQVKGVGELTLLKNEEKIVFE